MLQHYKSNSYKFVTTTIASSSQYGKCKTQWATIFSQYDALTAEPIQASVSS